MSTELKVGSNGGAAAPRRTQQAGVQIPAGALGELLAKAVACKPSLPGAVAQDVAALAGAAGAENPLNLRRVNTSTEIPVPPSFRCAKVRLEVAGYSNSKLSQASGYKYEEAMRGLVSKGGEGRVGLLVSPTADPGSVDAATTGAAFRAGMPLLSVTAEPYAKYIKEENLDAEIPRERYAAQPKFVLPDIESYVQANAELTNSWLAMGGGDIAGKAFRHHVELDHPIVLVDDGRGPCLSVEGLRSENASVWLAGKMMSHLTGGHMCSVVHGGELHIYDLGKTVEIARAAAVAAKAGGTTVESELAKRSSLPAEAFADAMMFDKSGLSEEWFRRNMASPSDVRISVLKVAASSPQKVGARAVELLERELSLR